MVDEVSEVVVEPGLRQQLRDFLGAEAAVPRGDSQAAGSAAAAAGVEDLAPPDEGAGQGADISASRSIA
ncbi:hypothetical protein STRMOE7_06745 [Streptomyces sp. MOE7]|nr:hypothetical protein STRMOE7_06745 [Streptomyces sp. MOE7]